MPGLVVAIAFHEFAHAWVADRLGDPTPRLNGRLTLEPWAHLDLLGTLMLLLYGFGWAKPVPVDPFQFRSPRRDMAAVAMAGPAMNLAVATMCWCLAGVVGVWRGLWVLGEVLRVCGTVNISFAAFNLIPLPPLDGFRLASAFLPPSVKDVVSRLESYSPLLLVLLMLSGLGSVWVSTVGSYMRVIVAGVANVLGGGIARLIRGI
ncbi:MAG: site-2 protease family protein [Bacillota bacterium]